MTKSPELEEAKEWAATFFPSPNTICTRAFSQFLRDYRASSDLFMFTVQLASNADKVVSTASKALLAVGGQSQEERERLEKSVAEPDAAFKKLRSHAEVLSQNLTNGFVNAFQRYFSTIIQSAAEKRPALMSSSQTIRIDDVFRFTKHRDLVAFIIDRKVNDLSYGGIFEMERYFDERLGIQMFNDDEQRALLRMFVEARNINVHNGAVVNDLFASRVGKVDGFPYTKGARFYIDLDRLGVLSKNAMRVAKSIDQTVSEKFGLKRQKHCVWMKKS